MSGLINNPPCCDQVPHTRKLPCKKSSVRDSPSHKVATPLNACLVPDVMDVKTSSEASKNTQDQLLESKLNVDDIISEISHHYQLLCAEYAICPQGMMKNFLGVKVHDQVIGDVTKIANSLHTVANEGVVVTHEIDIRRSMAHCLDLLKQNKFLLLAIILTLLVLSRSGHKSMIAMSVAMVAYCTYSGIFDTPSLVHLDDIQKTMSSMDAASVNTEATTTTDSSVEPHGPSVWVSTIMVAMYGIVFGCSYDTTKKSVDMSKLIRDFGALPRVGDSFVSLLDYSMSLVCGIGEVLRKMGADIDPTTWYGNSEVAKYSKEVNDFLTEFKIGMPLTHALGEKVAVLQNKGRVLMSQNTEVFQRDDKKQVLDLLRMLVPIDQKLASSGLFGSGTRIEPLGILIGGGSGVGKSTSIHTLLDGAMVRLLPKEEAQLYMENPKCQKYNYVAEQDHHNGFHGQKIVLFDDFAQQVDVAGGRMTEYNAVIRIINYNEWMANTAALEGKGTLYFNPTMVAATTNMKCFHNRIKSIIEPAAVSRRFDEQLWVCPRPEFAVSTADPNRANWKLDVSKAGVGNIHALHYFKHDFLTGITDYSRPMTAIECMHRWVLRSKYKKEVGLGLFEASAALMSQEYAREHGDKSERIPISPPEMPAGLDTGKDKLTLSDVLFDDIHEDVTKTNDMSTSTDDASTISASSNTTLVREETVPQGIGDDVVNATIDIVQKCTYPILSFADKMGRKVVRSFTGDWYYTEEDDLWYTDCPEEPYTNCVRDVADYYHEVDEMKGVPTFERKRSNWATECFPDVNEKMRYQLNKDYVNFEHFLFRNKLENVTTRDFMPHYVTEVDNYFRLLKEKCVAGDTKAILKVIGTGLGLLYLVKTFLSPFLRTENATYNSYSTFNDNNYYNQTEDLKNGDVTSKHTMNLETGDIVGGDKLPTDPESDYVLKERTKQRRTTKATKTMRRLQSKSDPQYSVNDQIRRLSSSIVSHNHYEFIIGGVKCGYMTFLRGTYGVIPLHFYDYLQNYVDKHGDDSYPILLKKCGGTDVSVPLQFSDIEAFATEDETDLCLVRVHTSKIHSHPNITKYIGNVIPERNLTGVLVQSFGPNATLCTSKLETIKDFSYTEYKLTKGFSYNIKTNKGDCGALLFLVTNHTPILLGIHVAGNISRGYANYMDVNILDSFNEIMDGDAETVAQIFTEIPEHIVNSVTSKMLVVGEHEQSFVSSKTRIIPSVLMGKLGEVHTTPSHLKPFVRDGEKIDPLLKAFSKYSGLYPKVSLSIIDPIVQRLSYEMTTNTVEQPFEPRVFTFEEACAGIQGVPYFDGLSRGKSAGLDPPGNPSAPGKTAYFGKDGDYTFTSEYCKLLRVEVEEQLAMLRKGILPSNTSIVIGKDARLPTEKALKGKLRAFDVSRLSTLIVFRMYFGDFVRYTQTTRHTHSIAVGTNPYSMDWDDLAKYITSAGPNVGDGDYRSYDTSQAGVWLMSSNKVVEAYYYNSKSVDRLIRHGLVSMMCTTTHLFRGVVYQWFGSMASGCFLTLLFGCLVNIIATRYAQFLCLTNFEVDNIGTMEIVQKVEVLFKDIPLKSFGDDLLTNIASKLRDYVSHSKLVKAYATIGFEYTDGSKDNTSPDDKCLGDVTFLKRRFVYCKVARRYIAPLQLEVILESPMWTKNNVPEDQVYDTLASMYGELSLHDDEVWDKWSPIFRDVSRQHFNKSLPYEDKMFVRMKTLSLENHYY